MTASSTPRSSRPTASRGSGSPGDFDSRADAALADAYRGATDDAPASQALTLDFRAVGYINSTGIALIVRLLADARRDGHAGPGHRAHAALPGVFRITRLSDFMDIIEGDAA